MTGKRILKVPDAVRRMIAAGVVLALTAGAVQAQYPTGFVWDRQADWSGGQVQGSTLGNPDDDALGNPVWLYETQDNNQFGFGDTLMTWDPSWFGGPQQFWVWDDDQFPFFSEFKSLQLVSDQGSFKRRPKVTWISPNQDTTRVDVAGTLTVRWGGAGGVGSPTPVDVTITHFDPNENPLAVLLNVIVDKPIPMDSVGDAVVVPVSLSVDVQFGDRIEFKHSAQAVVGDPFGNQRWIDLIDNITITNAGEDPTGINDDPLVVAEKLAIYSYPNPFNPQTTIEFSIEISGPVRLSIFDTSGRLVRALVDGTNAAGIQRVRWDGRNARGEDVPSGIYFARLEHDGQTWTRKMVLLK